MVYLCGRARRLPCCSNASQVPRHCDGGDYLARVRYLHGGCEDDLASTDEECAMNRHCTTPSLSLLIQQCQEGFQIGVAKTHCPGVPSGKPDRIGIRPPTPFQVRI